MTYKIPEGAVITDIDSDYFVKEAYSRLSGLKVSTNKGDIMLLISPDSNCCEDYGDMFLETPDDISRFIGAKVIEISDVTTVNCKESYDCGGETQLKIVTNKGVLQYAVYNDHNGYYSHATFLQVFDYKERDSL